uniref:Zinc finger, CCCH-type with G patch domain n=1 Tax=Sinocyclocheilus grahami TaxID=75366 RepID=A0A672PN91_SINGR
MDESSLEEAIEIYSTQLQQVQVALSEDLQQLTEPTESSLGSVKKSQLLASLEEPSTNQDATSVTQETGELSEDSAEVKQNAEPDEEEEEYHNAMVVCPEEARVRVLYLHPTNKSMKPCGFYLGGKCRLLNLQGFFFFFLNKKVAALPHIRTTGRSGSARLWHNKSSAAFEPCVALVQRPRFASTAFSLTLLHSTTLINH